VTLELGGKSPAIVHGDFDHAVAARRIARGKLLNAGQTCIAPDYVIVQKNRVDEFVRLFREAAGRFYPRILDNPDYTSIVNQRHYDRLVTLVADARSKGAHAMNVDPARELPEGGIGAPDVRKIAPVVVTGVTDKMAIMRDEIFGPVLPVVAYDRLEDAVAYVNARPRPLALYYFDSDRRRVDRVMQSTVSGGASVNDTVLHFAQEGLPFGGIGPSGMGAYHGRDGFRTFSHGKGVFQQSRWNFADLLAPPFTGLFRRLIGFAVRSNGG
jgi:coniferyl-aldehyde dehydrogenase